MRRCSVNVRRMREAGRPVLRPTPSTLHLCADRKGVGSQEQVMGASRVYQGHRESARAPGGGWVQGTAGDPK